ncbi:MAG: vWA domain-containing protein [Anaerolineae bacterium]
MSTMMRVLAVAAVVTLVGVIVAGGPMVVAAQEMPCNVQADRTVSPVDLAVGETAHVEVTVTGECENESKGIDIFFVVDRTPTMFNNSYRPRFIDALQDGLKSFVNAMDFSKSKAGVLSYASNYQINRNLTDDQDAIIRAINAIRMTEETEVRGLPAAFRKATELIDNDGDPDNQKIIMIFAAGPDQNNDLVNMDTVTQAARNAGVTVVFFQFSTREVGSIYTHFVKAASDCDSQDQNVCVGYRFSASGPVEYKYAWAVTTLQNPAPHDRDIRSKLTDFAEHFLFGVEITQVDVREIFDWRVSFVEGSAVPPPTNPSSPPYWSADWEFPGSMPAGGIKVEYDVTVTEVGTYYVSDSSQAVVAFTDGRTYAPLDLPNPLLHVSDAATVTPTPTPTDDVMPTTPPATTDTPEVTQTITPTSTEIIPGEDYAILMPIASKP